MVFKSVLLIRIIFTITLLNHLTLVVIDYNRIQMFLIFCDFLNLYFYKILISLVFNNVLFSFLLYLLAKLFRHGEMVLFIHCIYYDYFNFCCMLLNFNSMFVFNCFFLAQHVPNGSLRNRSGIKRPKNLIKVIIPSFHFIIILHKKFF